MKKILMSLALAAVSAMAFAAQPSADDAKALVEQQAKTVFTKLNANQSRYRNDPGAFSDLIKSEVLPYMDFELMSQVVLGRHWRDASAQQKADFTAAFRDLFRLEGIIPALESAHAVAYGLKLARELGRGKRIIVNLSGRGDKDINTIAARDGITL